MVIILLLVLSLTNVDEALLLSKIITAECSICPVEEQYLVGSTVLNRVDHSDFPNNIEGVLKQPGQFIGYNSKWFVSTKSTYKIAKNLLKGVGRDREVLYFYKLNAYDKGFTQRMNKYIKYFKEHHVYARHPKS